MSNPIQEIKRFQIDRQLHTLPFNWGREAGYIIEELMEAEGYSFTAKGIPVEVAKQMKNNAKMTWGLDKKEPSREEKVDAFCDVIVFAIGAIMKLGYDPECALEEVAKEINSRKGYMENGRFIKDEKDERYKAEYGKCVKNV